MAAYAKESLIAGVYLLAVHRGSIPIAWKNSCTEKPTDLTQLAKSHGGNFPADQVAVTLKFGSGPTAHGSADMPVWGPLFRSLEKYHDAVVPQRISNLVKYIEGLQVK